MVDNQRTAMHPSIFHGLFGGWVAAGAVGGEGDCAGGWTNGLWRCERRRPQR